LIGAKRKEARRCLRGKSGDLVVAVSSERTDQRHRSGRFDRRTAALALGEALGVIDKTPMEFLWLTGFPLFE